MTINELKEKYEKAHQAYLQYKDTNVTNNVEAQYMPEVLVWLKKIRPTSTFILNNDNFLNYLGVDIIEISITGDVQTIDVKICQYCEKDDVLCDGWKHSDNIYYKATDVKVNDYFLFVNKDNYIIVPFKEVEKNIPKKEDCFYMKRDLCKTTLKYIFDTKHCRRYKDERITLQK